jgi:hypothetical protein
MLAKNPNHLRRELDWLKAKHIIDGEIYRDYLLLISNANAPEQLDQIAYDLADLRRPLCRPVSLMSS